MRPLDRFFLPQLDSVSEADVVELGERQSAHALRVKRHAVNDAIELFDGRGRIARGVIVNAVKRNRLLVRVDKIESVAPSTTRMHLATAVPRGDRMETLLDMATQLGVERVTPLVFERSASFLAGNRHERWQRVIAEACRQSRRNFLTDLREPVSLDDWLATNGYGARGALWTADPEGRPLSEVGEAAKPDELDELTVVVGPEGGLTREESCRLRDSGFCAVRFGEHILRVETAAVAVSAAALMTMQRSMSSRSGKTST